MGIEALLYCEEVKYLKEYKGTLNLSREGNPIAFDFTVKYHPDLIRATDKSLKNIDEFLNETYLDLKFRGALVSLPRELKSVLLYMIGNSTIKFYAEQPKYVKNYLKKISKAWEKLETKKRLKLPPDLPLRAVDDWLYAIDDSIEKTEAEREAESLMSSIYAAYVTGDAGVGLKFECRFNCSIKIKSPPLERFYSEVEKCRHRPL